jgi:hypothetical protein
VETKKEPDESTTNSQHNNDDDDDDDDDGTRKKEEDDDDDMASIDIDDEKSSFMIYGRNHLKESEERNEARGVDALLVFYDDGYM